MKFSKPTIEQIKAYAESIGFSTLDPEEFIDHYEAVGWKVGKNGLPMKCWKATIRTWRRNQRMWQQSAPPQSTSETPLERQARLDRIEKKALDEYAERINACRSWQDLDAPAPMGDPSEAERRLWIKAGDQYGPRFTARLKGILKAT